MNIFLPFPSIKYSLACLDDKRLLKQIVEAEQILKKTYPKSHKNHPAVKMIEQFPEWLETYCWYGKEIWKYRGILNRFEEYSYKNEFNQYFSPEIPPFLYHRIFHYFMRARLYEKKPDWYGMFWDSISTRYDGYIWPVIGGNKEIKGFRGQKKIKGTLLWKNRKYWMNNDELINLQQIYKKKLDFFLPPPLK